MNNFKEKLRNIPGYFLILMVIFLIGFCLRFYHFHDLLRFNADQSRDAGVIASLVENNSSLLILGPQAGGTKFRLGPIFYYFQYASAKIFGYAPDKIAYPDLLFSCLAILVMFFLFRKYFNTKISLILATILSFSAYAIKYSRFAWNPNSTSFFVPIFLLSLLQIADKKNKWNRGWAVVCGITLGILVQLHTFLIVIAPLTAFVFLFYLFRKKIEIKRNAFIIILFAFLVNIPQIAYEIKHQGANTKAFFEANEIKSSRGQTLTGNLSKNLFCMSQSNSYVVTSIGANDQCSFDNVKKGYQGTFKNLKNIDGLVIVLIAISLIFTLGGLFLIVYYFKREPNQDKKNFLFLLGIYIFLSFGVFLKFANEISLRYYIILLFQPFLTLGLLIKYLSEKRGRVAYPIILTVLVVFISLNIRTVTRSFNLNDSTFSNTSLSEIEFLSDFITRNTVPGKTAYVSGNKTYLFKSLKSVQFISRKSDIKIVEYKKNSILNENDNLFYIDNYQKSKPERYQSKNWASYGHFVIYSVE